MKRTFLFALTMLLLFNYAEAQLTDSTSRTLTLRQCIDFALQNQPAVKQAAIDEQINERDIRISLAGWLPQVTSAGSYNRYFQRANLFGAGTGTTTTGTGTNNGTGTPGGTTGGTTGGTGNTTGGTTTGSTTTNQSALAVAKNVSSVTFQASQVIYNNDVWLASRAKRYSRQYYSQNTLTRQIDVVADVSQAFFDVLLSQKQLDILNQDISRLQRSLKDAYTRYQAGVADKTDYKQATIALNNTIATRKQTQEAVNSKLAYLKQLMGYTPQKNLGLQYDSTRFVQEATIDTNQVVNVNNRIEYQQLVTQRTLQSLNVDYYKYGFLPSLSAIGSYSVSYFNENIMGLYNTPYPTSLVGLSLNLPIFTGTRRLQNLSKARLQVERVDLDIINQRNVINTEYVQALAGYKSNYTNWSLLKQNVDLAKDVYGVVSLQYREGIKTYLDVIVAQSDLRTAELNYYNALFQLLSSKIQLEKALGTLTVR
ncbi:TolC family protein [Mucilaginibacter sp. RS28]|uniref:TolC family protein n=1 Tax=Mucilaginibacter straminoryzae TaxID=2932774 RepID=A0A9X2BB73_9SPHI|nr:TolC family protein [Mucilaginibacter straminoryzae]MCJ8211515.1 TolC family protein [Mucilaginibacter straminoryzae]